MNWFTSLGKVIFCAERPTVKLRDTGEAGAYTEFPACAAVTVQVPALSSFKAFASMMQTVGVDDVKLTGSPELDRAISASGWVA